LKEIGKILPHENIFYLGDTARVPYGNKSGNTIIKYSIQNTRFLMTQGVKLLVVACNTSSALAIETLRREFKKLPIIGVIEPGSEQAIASTKIKKIGVIGTRATVSSNVYKTTIHKLEGNMKLKIFQQPCPLFVPIVEEGMQRTVFAESVAEYYLKHLKKHNIDTVILGCTHYPALSAVIRKIMGEDVKLVNSGKAVAVKVYRYLSDHNLIKTEGVGSLKFFVTDDSVKFKKTSRRLLSMNIDNNVRKVVLEDYE